MIYFAFFQFNGYCVCLLCLNSIHKLTLLLKGACEQKVFLWFDDNSFRTIINEPVSCCCFCLSIVIQMISIFIDWNFHKIKMNVIIYCYENIPLYCKYELLIDFIVSCGFHRPLLMTGLFNIDYDFQWLLYIKFKKRHKWYFNVHFLFDSKII